MLARRRKIDPLIVLIIAAVIVAVIAPARGWFADAFAVATNLAIAALFFLYGARLSTKEAISGLTHWRLHLTILAFTFAAYPLIVLGLRPLITAILSDELYRGVLFLALVPSTVQSSVAFTSIAKGNVAGAIVAASASSLVGVVATPLLVLALMSTGGGVAIDASVFGDIALLLLLPFVLGQLLRRWVKDFAANKATKVVDRGSITMVVYSAFSAGVVDGVWSRVSIGEILTLTVVSTVLVIFMLWLTRWTAQRLGFNREDTVAIEFCGSKKSLATGLPMATVIFGGASLGLLILPLMVYHQIQLMICAWLAARYGQSAAA
ncbi:bile acid:sodium symporter family protein [Corynebacterium uterequi]|uniref:Putative Na+-dependent transporter n=1 Tax=Corynebacterium uterequi TaxID=1072256 RepID=A0A0G3HHE4_9CORY|nr:bile acid:sodium symporter family protein [Corynebacterium uterequi]AKK12175.1 putative Na+-dependent transporter [Corynebacterium uterequi]